MLKLVRDGEDYARNAFGMSGHAGAQTTMQSLVRHGLLAWTDEDDLVITAHGRVTLRSIEKT